MRISHFLRLSTSVLTSGFAPESQFRVLRFDDQFLLVKYFRSAFSGYRKKNPNLIGSGFFDM